MNHSDEDLDTQIAGVAALDEPVRRRLYDYVIGQPDAVGRDEAARTAGVSRALAAFHLDRLVDEGLLETEYRRLSGRTGPGAGRPSKLYRRSERQIQVSLPPRRYELAARLFAAALDGARSPEALAALNGVARAFGRQLGEPELRTQQELVPAGALAPDTTDTAGADSCRSAEVERALGRLAACGYEPLIDRDDEGAAGVSIRLRNCPFHALAAEHRALVCGMNLALMEGFVEGLASTGTGQEGLPSAQLDPQPGMCCVRLRLEQANQKHSPTP